jgi:hypothetical protein
MSFARSVRPLRLALTTSFGALAVAASTSHAQAAPDSDALAARRALADTTPRRRHAVEYSDWYARRLTVHRIGSYAMLPLFGAEYALGERLLSDNPQPGWVKPTHVGVAAGLGALFAVNMVTGVWNLYDSRHDPAGRTRRLLHTTLMLAADAGFAYTGLISSGNAAHSLDGRTQHRNAALVSMGIGTVGTALMWLWK